MKKSAKNLTIYISGPMTGYKDYNYPKFDRIANSLREKGYTVINPASDIKPMLKGGKEMTIKELYEARQNGTIDEKTAWGMFMRGDLIAVLKDCDAIYLLKGWKKSKGARKEMNLAKMLGFIQFNEGELI